MNPGYSRFKLDDAAIWCMKLYRIIYEFSVAIISINDLEKSNYIASQEFNLVMQRRKLIIIRKINSFIVHNSKSLDIVV